jgi:hypothetical protein
MTAVEQWQIISNLLVAIGTLLIAILAIWGERIKYRCVGPKLSVTLVDPRGEQVDISSSPNSPKWARYYHLRVANKRRWAPANNVRVVITQILKPSQDGELANSTLSGPLQLRWQFADLSYRTVGPEVICDLGHLIRDQKFSLTPYHWASNFEGSLQPNQSMLVVVQAVADNAESNPLCISITWDGIWTDDTDEMQTHLIVREVDGSRIVEYGARPPCQ